ncbi:MAG: DNA sulfur modification protein DndD [Cellvibrionaceae bacterium]|nr:DNA sulfur modification protein DndD [Cellvibrionaceae bacterium]
MIIDSITLENFRVFKGSHQINLAPSPEKSIVLFGGLNGAGKTSILTAIRFALLGRVAIPNASTNAAYIERLSELVHGKDPSLTTTITIEFLYQRDGKAINYKVCRQWRVGHADKLDILEDGDSIKANYEQSQAFLLELVPPGIADLVFFDGEKIADLAEDTSGVVLKQAVKRLLGLDTISRLKDDLAIYLKKSSVNVAGVKVREAIQSLEVEKETCFLEAEEQSDLADKEARILSELNTKIAHAEQEVLSGGGAWADDKEKAKAKVEALIKLKAEKEGALLRELDGPYALSLAPKTMTALMENMALEQEVNDKRAFAKGFEQILPGIAADIGEDDDTLKLIKARVSSHAVVDTQNFVEFGFSRSHFEVLKAQATSQSEASAETVKTLKGEIEKLASQIEQAAIHIQRAPEKEQLQEAFEKLKSLEHEQKIHQASYRKHLELQKEQLTKAQVATTRLIKLQSDLHKSKAHTEITDRAEGSIELLDDFSGKLINLRLEQLEEEFIKSYKKLARKEDLDLSAKIDHKSFDVELCDEHGRSVNRESLSAGEKQIYAISMLDALAKVSGRRLPVVIDTPLGRLDSHHRHKLVENYFPKAAEQVVILSTDTEIDEAFFQGMEEHIAHAYEICFDGASRSSSVREGYFWKNQTIKAVS